MANANGGKAGAKIDSVVKDDRKARAEACMEEMEKALKKHRCAIAAYPYIDHEGRVKVQQKIEAEP